jgi:membrane associated rhomboid family serine protease
MSITDDIKRALNGSYGAVYRLLAINVAVFLALAVLNAVLKATVAGYSYGAVRNWIELPGNAVEAGMHFWTLITHQFIHNGFLHLLGNMLMLYFLGRLFTDFIGGHRLTGIYLLGGIAGGILFVGYSQLVQMPNSPTLLGASGAVMAILAATATIAPDTELSLFGVIPVRLKWLALIIIALYTLSEIAQGAGGRITHLGGAAFGFLYGLQLRKGKPMFEGFMRLFTSAAARRSRSKLRVEHVQRSRAVTANDELYNQNKAMIRRRIDEILDKISRSGYDSLSRDEREFLQKNHDKT